MSVDELYRLANDVADLLDAHEAREERVRAAVPYTTQTQP